MHTELPTAVVYLPAAHDSHDPIAVAPVVAKDVPAAQSTHTELPTAVVYLPVAHVTHDSIAVAPVVAKDLPAAQSVHTSLPGTSIHFPAAHFVQSPPGSPEKPAGQVQLLADMLAFGAVEKLGHDWHAPPYKAHGRYVFTAHSIQPPNISTPIVIYPALQ